MRANPPTRTQTRSAARQGCCGRIRSVASLLVGLTLSTAAGQERLWCRSLGVEDGLSQSFITAIAQDRDGFMWFGTAAGLSRWDGYDFANHQPALDGEWSLGDAAIQALHAGRDGRLWVGTRRGLGWLEPGSDTFRRCEGLYREPGSEEPLIVETITSDRAGRIWLACFEDPRLHRYDPRTGQASEHRVGDPTNQIITALQVDEADCLWVGVRSGYTPLYRLFGFEHSSGLEGSPLPQPDRSLPLDEAGREVVCVTEDAAHRLWFGRVGGGLLRFDPTTGAVVRRSTDALNLGALESGHVRSITLDPSGRLWVLTHLPAIPVADRADRLYRVNADTLQVTRIGLERGSLLVAPNARLDCLAIDRSGVLWLGSNAGGLRYADVSAGGISLYLKRGSAAPGLRTGYVGAVCKGRDGTVWAGTPGGLIRIDRSGPEAVCTNPARDGLLKLPDLNVHALCEDRQGDLWIGTVQGLAVVRNPPGTVEYHGSGDGATGGLAGDFIRVIHEDRAGGMWVAAEGLNEFDPESRTFRQYPAVFEDFNALPSPVIHALYSDGQNRLWVGTDAGLARLDPAPGFPRRVERVATGSPGLEGVAVLAISESAATPGVLWVGTADLGLCRLDLRDESCRFYHRRNSGIPDDTVCGVLPDATGRLWMSSNRGLACFDPERETFDVFGVAHGLQSSEFNSRACFRAPDGEMFFGGVDGLNAFHPEQVTRNPHPPQVCVTAVHAVDRRARRPGEAARLIYRRGMPAEPSILPFAERDLTLDYVALHYANAPLNQCEYRLEGYETAWNGPTLHRQARYTNLDPGHYTFRVRALSSQGVPSLDDAVFSFVILAPFYATAWFRAVAGLGVLLALLGAYRLRVRHLRRRHRELEDQVADRTEELRQAFETVERQAARLKALDSAKSRFFANISHEFRTPLTLTLGPLEDIRAGLHGRTTEAMRHELDLAIRNTHRQLELVDQLLTLARLDSGTLTVQLRAQALDGFLRLAAAPYESLAKRQGVRIELELPESPVSAVFDGQKLDQVIGNLLANAIRFSPRGGTVTVRLATAAEGESYLAVVVEDQGPGIRGEDLPRIFERFYRGAPGEAAQLGTGIGLSIARELIELHDGTIRAENRPGGGARFTVTLPARTASDGVGEGPGNLAVTEFADLDPARPPEPVALAEGGPLEAGEPRREGRAAESEDPGDAQRPTVLIVEDHPDMRVYLRKHLAPDYRVIEADRGEEALRVLRREVPDVVISDVMMPEMDGHELLRAVRSDPETDFIPVILLTADAGAEGKLRGIEGGADDYIIKPFDATELRARIRNLLRLRQRLKNRFSAGEPGRKAPGAVLAPAETEAAGRRDPSAQSQADALADRVRRILASKSGDDTFNVEALGRELGMSRAQLHRRLKEELGKTPAEMIMHFRLETAAGLLKSRAGNVAEVAYAVGFKNVAHFVKRFREHHGLTPAAYAARARAEGR